MEHSPSSQAVEMEFAMISLLLALHASAAFEMQSDTTRASRETFTTCLRRFVDSSLESGKTLDQFRTAFPAACAAEQTAFREAIIRRDMASRATRASAEDSANLEVEDARVNFNDRFEMSMTPRQAAAAPAARPAAAPAAQTAAQTAPTPAAQPASQPQ
jgi:hypothetical protein